MSTLITKNTQQVLTIPITSGQFRYVIEDDATLELHYMPGVQQLDQEVAIELLGDNASLELNGVFRDLHHDTSLKLKIIHLGKNTDALATIRGVLAQPVSVNITATIRIEPGATGTDTYYQADFLKLNNDGSIRTQPNLEINESDIVNAGHGSSCGRMDESQLQYLEARGLNREQAKGQLIDAFLNEMNEGGKDVSYDL